MRSIVWFMQFRMTPSLLLSVDTITNHMSRNVQSKVGFNLKMHIAKKTGRVKPALLIEQSPVKPRRKNRSRRSSSHSDS